MKLCSITPQDGGLELRVYHATRSRLKDSSASMDTLPLVVREIGNHHLNGTPRPRSRHFSTVRSLIPRERPASTIKFQSSEVVMAALSTDASSELQRHFDGGRKFGAPLPYSMEFDEIEPDRDRLIRIKLQMRYHREVAKMSKAKMAAELKEAPDNYEKYEEIPGPAAKDQTLREPPLRVLQKFTKRFDLDFEMFCNNEKRNPLHGAFYQTPPVADLIKLLSGTDTTEVKRKRGRPKSIQK